MISEALMALAGLGGGVGIPGSLPVIFESQAAAISATTADVSKLNCESFLGDDSAAFLKSTGEEGALQFDDLEPYLVNLYGNSGFTEWKVDEVNSFDVADVYGLNPKELSDSDPLVKKLMDELELTRNHIGCGPLALLSQLQFLSSGPGYCELYSRKTTSEAYRQLYSDLSDAEYNDSLERIDDIDLAKYVFSNLPVTDLFGYASLTMPSDFVSTAGQLLESYGLASISTTDDGKLYFSESSQIVVKNTGLTFNRMEANFAEVKQSIDRGMPVVFYTFAMDESYEGISGHMMNIYGYEKWISKNSSGEEKTYYFLKLNLNWGRKATRYIPKQYFDGYFRCGFIYFEEQFDHIGLSPADHDFLPCAYNNEVQTTTISKKGFNIDMEYLRLGYIDAYTPSGSFSGKRLVLSCIRDDYRDAYVRYDFKRKIKSLCLRLNVWNANDFNPSGNRYCVLKLFRKDGMLDYPYNISLDGLSTSYDSPSCFRPSFLKEDYGFSLNVWSDIGLGSGRNRGRMVIQGVSVCFAD